MDHFCKGGGCAGLRQNSHSRGQVAWGGITLAVAVAVSPGRAAGDGLPMLKGADLVLLLADLLAITFAGQRFFDALLFTGLQIKRVPLDFLDNVFGLHLTLETTQGILKGFAFLYSNLCQEKYTSKRSRIGILDSILRNLGTSGKILRGCEYF